MSTLSTENRRLLEQAIVSARGLAERATRAALEALAVGRAKPDGHMTDEQKAVRNHLRARARQLGDKRAANDTHEIEHLVRECAYEHWHRMLFARFLAENNLLIEPDAGVAISLDECKELAKEEKTDLWTLAGRYAQRMLPQIFRADDPVLKVRLAREDELKLEGLVDWLPVDVFTATDSLGWCYQFWQTDEKKRVNESETKIGADELPAVTQLFTEDYMVGFLLDNTLGAWWFGRKLSVIGKQLSVAKTEEECRRLIALPGCEWKYLRFVKDDKAGWRPAAGTFDGWPKTVKELKCMDPCCGSGHFLVAMFERLVALRMAEEGLNKRKAAEAVVRDNIFGLEIDPRCTQIAAFNLALAAWKFGGHAELPGVNVACSGLEVGGTKAEWVAIAPENGFEMEQLYGLFKNATTLGSLINPRQQVALELAGRAFGELTERIVQGLDGFRKARDFDNQELGVTAQGIAGAFRLSVQHYSLVATNVPYLARGKHSEVLRDYIDVHYSAGKADLATAFVLRCLDLCSRNGATALVTPEGWLYKDYYSGTREYVLDTSTLRLVCPLGAGAFETISGEEVKPQLSVASLSACGVDHEYCALDCRVLPYDQIAGALQRESFSTYNQQAQKKNTKCTIRFAGAARATTLESLCSYHNGICAGDMLRFYRFFWEFPRIDAEWEFIQTTTVESKSFAGCESVFHWGNGSGPYQEYVRDRLGEDNVNAWIRGLDIRGRQGLLVSATGSLKASLFLGTLFSETTVALTCADDDDLPGVACYVLSDEYDADVRAIDTSLKVRGPLIRVNYDKAKWDAVAKKTFPNGLPEPESNQPTQWLFTGWPGTASDPVHATIARLLGYRWPTELDKGIRVSKKAQELAKRTVELLPLADDDGIVCIPSVRGEPGAADRLLRLLTAAGIKPDRDLDEWLRNSFFEEHCTLFHDRPFVWHIWDGRKRDGFHALVNYHKLADGVKGRRLLEKLTHAYLGDWITRQRADVKDEKEGAEERLAAALALKERLEAILAGEPPFDIFVRWKPLAKQATGWEPDINDGVRLNIRPFMASDLPGGKKGAGVLRARPNIKWDKDRGKEPNRPKAEFPWFWSWDEESEDFMGGREFDGNRWNDCHYTIEAKAAARKEVK